MVFAMPGVTNDTLARLIENRRANGLDDTLVAPTVSLTMDFETFACLHCGGRSRCRHCRPRDCQWLVKQLLGRLFAQMHRMMQLPRI
jgi:hypothetical protein